MKKSIAEIINLAISAKGNDAKALVLQQHDSVPLRTILKYALDPEVVWSLPEGSPPYKKNDLPGQEMRFYAECRKLYLFIEGTAGHLRPIRREQLFIEFLEGLDAKDAEIVILAKDKKLPKGLTRAIVDKAFPGLISTESEAQN